MFDITLSLLNDVCHISVSCPASSSSVLCFMIIDAIKRVAFRITAAFLAYRVAQRDKDGVNARLSCWQSQIKNHIAKWQNCYLYGAQKTADTDTKTRPNHAIPILTKTNAQNNDEDYKSKSGQNAKDDADNL